MQRIKTAIKLIRQGKVIVCPTDTVYGLIADATDKKAVEKIFKIKKRKDKKPVPIFVKDLKMAKRIAKIDKKQEKFLKSVWPGKVTVVLERKMIRRVYGINKRTIALRIPNFKPVNFLLEKLNRPLVGTSANISGKLPSGNLKEILRQFKGKKYQPDLIVDGGNLKPDKPSTVLDLTIWPAKILRP